MQFQHYNLGNLKGGEIVEVTLQGNAANVKLMDSSNFQNYKNGRKHTYYGGHVTRSPYKVSVPRAGNWYITIDLGGYNGRVKSGVRLLPGILPQVRQAPLSTVPSLVQNKEISTEPDTAGELTR